MPISETNQHEMKDEFAKLRIYFQNAEFEPEHKYELTMDCKCVKAYALREKLPNGIIISYLNASAHSSTLTSTTFFRLFALLFSRTAHFKANQLPV